MATINNKLIHFKSKSDFNGRYAESTDGGKTYGDFLGTSIVFIQDAKQIWTHGQFYDANEATLASLGITATAEELNKLDGVTATTQELNYVDGVTSNIQTQLNNKAASSHNHSAANITSGTLDLARIPSITDAKIISVSASKITGTIPQANLPSYVDDVLEYRSKSSFPQTGEAGKIYVDTTTNLTYRWGGSSYVEISPSLALGETSSTAFRGDRGKIAYDHSQATGNPHNLTLSNLGISATAAELNFVDGVTSNIQTQLNAKANTSSLSSYALKSGSNASGTWPISISGNAATATKLAAARSLWGRSFDGSGNVSGDMTGVGRINNGLIISQFGTSADNSDTTRFLINGHQLEFGGYGYAHQVYYFRPQYSANGETYADMYIQNASASDSPVFSTTHYFDHNGNAYHWGNLGLGTVPSSSYKLNVAGTGYFSGLLTASGGLFGLTKAQADTYAGNSNYYNLAVGQKASSMGASILMYRDSATYQSFIVWSTKTQDHIGIGLAPSSDELIIENHKAGIQLKGKGNLTYNDYPLLHSNNYTSYTVTKTGGGASGTWNINISGTAASANSVAWNNVSGKPSSFTPASHTHTASQVSGLAKVATSGNYNDLINKPNIPEGTEVDAALSSTSVNPVQNKVITSALNGKANTSHNHSQYLTSSSLSGYATQSWVKGQGYLTTPYTLPTASASTLGGVKIGSGVNISSGVISVTTSSIGAATASHTHSQYLTSSSLSGYATQSWVNSQGFIKSATDTKNTAGSAETSSKIWLVGAIRQAESSVTYSNSSVYTQSGQLYASQMNATNGFFETSDARLKTFGGDVKSLDSLSKIPTKYFTWKLDENQKQHIGTSAQEVQKIYPELVSENETGELSVDYARLSIIALAAIKELKEEIEELKSKI